MADERILTESGHHAITHAVTMFSGFLQRLGQAGSGLVQLEYNLHRNYVGPNNRIRLYPWNSNVSDVAESLWRYRPKNTKQLHYVVGYSYGGQAAYNMVHELMIRGGCVVKCLVLCDPVVRYRFGCGVPAFFGLGSFHVPKGVRECWAIRQQTPRFVPFREGGWFQPAGHPVVGDRVEDHDDYIVAHSYMDNLDNFHSRVIDEVGNFLQSDLK